MAANITPGGRKSHRLGYHFSIAPGGESIIAGGLSMREPAQLNRLRDAIVRDSAPLKAISKNKDFKRYFGELRRFPVGCLARTANPPQGRSIERPYHAVNTSGNRSRGRNSEDRAAGLRPRSARHRFIRD
jgi:hypothetical protein